ncbi:glutamate--cysteine ligase [Jatrophihabitans sp. GAS493]|uniref:carboxylate-amine ligase n=1 Tax=Jatrophihabitans sp. GAS493 TaxID=1907575 RepID=UPI0018D5A3E5|nr:glutamate--cysteine ligase [Jatrophihabitans sp. GAS493]
MRTVGVEEEFLLVHAGSSQLAAAGDEVVAAAEAASDGQFEHELKRQQAELGTRPTTSLSELAGELRRRRSELASAAAGEGARLLACGTSPLDQHVSTTPVHRYEQMMRVFGRVARTQLTCGMHVHVSVESPDEGVAVLDRIRPWLALLVALSANSPFLAGEDTGYASYRTVLWGQWPTSGIADPFGDVAGYERARAALVSSGAAIDDGMIYFDARLSARYPTVEVRVADVCANAADAVTIAAVVRGLVSTAATAARDGREVLGVRSELLRAASWRAARFGTEQDLVDVSTAHVVPAWNLIDHMVDVIGPALLDAGDSDLVHSGLEDLRRRGSGARLQRLAYTSSGSIDGIVDAVAAQTIA